MTDKELLDLHKKSFKNKQWLQQCGHYGCFYCLKWGNIQEVKEYTDGNQTGICPHCRIDSLIAFKIEDHEEFVSVLKEMREKFF